MIAEYVHQVPQARGLAGQMLSSRLSPSAPGDARAKCIAVFFGETGYAQSIGNRTRAADFFDSVLTTRGFHDKRLPRVGDQKAVVISERSFLVAAPATLSMHFDQAGDSFHGPFRTICPLQGESHQIHAGEPALGIGFVCENGLVADRDATLIRADLGTPHPKGAAQQDGVRVIDLRDFDPRALNARAGRMSSARLPVEQLCLVGITIRVLSEEHAFGLNDH
jgi:hypothetical protein